MRDIRHSDIVEHDENGMFFITDEHGIRQKCCWQTRDDYVLWLKRNHTFLGARIEQVDEILSCPELFKSHIDEIAKSYDFLDAPRCWWCKHMDDYDEYCLYCGGCPECCGGFHCTLCECPDWICNCSEPALVEFDKLQIPVQNRGFILTTKKRNMP